MTSFAIALVALLAPVQDATKDTIDVVFCIDCSGSMGPVIETAKKKVWAVVNEIAKDRPKAALRIGLIGYGNADAEYRFFNLTDDLDQVYQDLMKFKDEGWGDEWVGLVIHKARTEMKWTRGKNVLRILFVVGNETARQGPEQFDYAKTAPEAIKSEIVVNAIYCGDYDLASATPTWKEMAKLADGSYQEIAAQGGSVSIATPFDKDLAELSAKLNGTYVAYGRRAKEGEEKQKDQDDNAQAKEPAAAADRALAKSSEQYNNAYWDLVDASRDEKFDLKKLRDEELSEEMKKMSVEERKAFIETKAKERAELQVKIRELSEKRDAYTKEEMAKQGLSADKALDEAVKKMVREQAAKKGEAFGK
ncbi:MAG TPA: vWA domain-containing protein [Planctomycetota bacterium]|nr:vWA domain-containing protein [Planctomycetota bacterium]